MRKNLLKLLLVVGLVASSHLTSEAAPPQNSGIIVTVADLPTFVPESYLRIISTKGKKVDMSIPVFNFTTVQVPLKAGVYTLIIVPVGGESSAPPSAPMLVQVERKQFTPLTLSYSPESQ